MAVGFCSNGFAGGLISGRPLAVSRGRKQVVARRVRPLFAQAQDVQLSEPVQERPAPEIEELPENLDDFELDMEPDLVARLQTLGDDVQSRPLYYANAVGVLAGFYLTTTVLRSVLNTINKVPLAQDTFEVIGLVYIVWFLWEYVSDGNKRSEFGDRVGNFVNKIK